MIGGWDTDKIGAVTSETNPETPTLLIAVQDEAVRERLRALLEASNLPHEILNPSADPLEGPPHTGADLIVVRRSRSEKEDYRLVDAYTNEDSAPGLVVLTEQDGDAERARLIAAGASSVLQASDSNEELREGLEAIVEAEQDVAPHGGLEDGIEPAARMSDFASRSTIMRRFVDLVSRIVDTDSSLLITGETGVGKERLAQAIHNGGPRKDRPFVSLNCGAIPELLLESELFGHEAGAFTGAGGRKKGRFEQANGGTIFLDEIGEMPPHLQVNLLTVLQRRQVQRVGSEDIVPVNVRVMAATNRDVVDEVANGSFREDLYYRLSVVPLCIPSLRERPEDIPDLVGKFIHHFREALGRPKVESISNEAIEAMMLYEWPGNIRELINTVEHAVVLCQSSRISIGDLPETIIGSREDDPLPVNGCTAGKPPIVRDEWLNLPLREARRRVELAYEREYLEALLKKTCGVVGKTAELAGIAPRSLYDKMQRHGLRKEDYRQLRVKPS
ncbi:MAG: two-component system response regulator AtoC [Planctomycetota bacterium]